MPVIKVNNRAMLAPLFEKNRYDTVLMNCALKGYFGVACANSITSPSVARLDSGAFTILGRDPNAPAVTALLRHSPIYYVTPENSDWRRVLRAEFGDRLSALGFTELSSQLLNINHLLTLTQELAAGFELVKIDELRAEQLPSDLNIFSRTFCQYKIF